MTFNMSTGRKNMHHMLLPFAGEAKPGTFLAMVPFLVVQAQSVRVALQALYSVQASK